MADLKADDYGAIDARLREIDAAICIDRFYKLEIELIQIAAARAAESEEGVSGFGDDLEAGRAA